MAIRMQLKDRPTEAELQENFKVYRGDPSHWHIKGERVRH